MRALLALALLALLSGIPSAAFVHGDIYGPGMQKMNNTMIRVEGSYSYAMASEGSEYSFFLPEGDYKISASGYGTGGDLESYAEENVRVGGEDQRIDLVMRPAFRTEFLLYGAVVLLFFAVAMAFLWKDKQKAPEPRMPLMEAAIPEKREEKPVKLDEDMKKILQALESNEKRATQKELKEMLHFSDAKLSLIIAELEEGGYVKKFKRGRGNIIRKL